MNKCFIFLFYSKYNIIAQRCIYHNSRYTSAVWASIDCTLGRQHIQPNIQQKQQQETKGTLQVSAGDYNFGGPKKRHHLPVELTKFRSRLYVLFFKSSVSLFSIILNLKVL